MRLDLTEQERDAVFQFLMQYAPDTKLELDGWDKPTIDALDRAYDKLIDSRESIGG